MYLEISQYGVKRPNVNPFVSENLKLKSSKRSWKNFTGHFQLELSNTKLSNFRISQTSCVLYARSQVVEKDDNLES